MLGQVIGSLYHMSRSVQFALRELDRKLCGSSLMGTGYSMPQNEGWIVWPNGKKGVACTLASNALWRNLNSTLSCAFHTVPFLYTHQENFCNTHTQIQQKDFAWHCKKMKLHFSHNWIVAEAARQCQRASIVLSKQKSYYNTAKPLSRDTKFHKKYLSNWTPRLYQKSIFGLPRFKLPL